VDQLTKDPFMTETAEHYNPIGKAETLEVWRRRMRMPVPTAEGYISDLRILAVYETTSVNGLPLDLLNYNVCSRTDSIALF
jgi:hypothetical protein